MSGIGMLRRDGSRIASWGALAAGMCVAAAATNASAQTANVDPVTGRAEAAPAPASPPPAETAATATTAPSSPAPATEQPTRSRWGHRMQGEIRVVVNEGYGFAIKYDGGTPCDSRGSTFCRGRTPVTLDFAAGFGALEWLEVEARFRLGVESTNGFEFSTGPGSALPMAAGVGVRVYGSETSRLKFAFGAAALLDFTAGQQLDVIARLDQGLHYDVARQFGFYLQLGESITFRRALGFALDGGFGIQGRFP